MKISKSKDFGFSCVALKGNNAKVFLLNNRKTVLIFFVDERKLAVNFSQSCFAFLGSFHMARTNNSFHSLGYDAQPACYQQKIRRNFL
jgi:hypothetical protein